MAVLLPHVTKSSDLVTSPEDTQKGFLVQALRKTQEASPYVQEAKRFWERLAEAKSIDALAAMPSTQDHLIAAAGFSEKAKNYFSTEELQAAVGDVLRRIAADAGENWRVELLYRFLLTRGDTLGGMMRNIVGSIAQEVFVESLIGSLKSDRVTPHVCKHKTGKVKTIQWTDRRLLFDRKPKLIGKNVDVILMDTASFDDDQAALLAVKDRYLACGELKGGIDPAGADEHWKTATSALGRIRRKLAPRCPPLFFVGAAIEISMAREIVSQLRSGKLSHAANLSSPAQLTDLTDWLVAI